MFMYNEAGSQQHKKRDHNGNMLLPDCLQPHAEEGHLTEPSINK